MKPKTVVTIVVVLFFGGFVYLKTPNKYLSTPQTMKYTPSQAKKELAFLKTNILLLKDSQSRSPASFMTNVTRQSILHLKTSFFKESPYFKSDDPSLLELHESLEVAIENGKQDFVLYLTEIIELQIARKEKKIDKSEE